MIKKVFPILAISIFSATLGIGIVVPLLPLYADKMGASGPQLGMIFAGYAIVNSIATPFIGRLSDSKGRKPFLCSGLLFYALLSLGYIWAADVSQLILIRFIQGVAGAMVMPIALAYVGDISPVNEEGKWMGYANAAFFSGFGFGPLLGGVLTDYFGMNVSFYAFSGFCLLAFLTAVPFLPETKEKSIAIRTRLSFKEMSRSPMIRGLFILRLGQDLGRGGLMTFLPIFAATYAGLSTTLVGILVAINMLFATALMAPAGRITDRFNRKTMVVLGSVVLAISLALIPLARSFWLLVLVAVPQAIGAAISMTAANALTVVEGREFGMGSTMSLMVMAMSIGSAIGPIASGAIADSLNIDSVFFFGAVVGIITACLFAAKAGRR